MGNLGTTTIGKIWGMANQVAQKCAGVFTLVFCFAVTAMAFAAQNPFDPKASAGGGKFKSAPKAPDAEDADAAGEGLNYIMGVHLNTIFFVAAGLVAVFWFTLGGGRKPKVSRDAS